MQEIRDRVDVGAVHRTTPCVSPVQYGGLTPGDQLVFVVSPTGSTGISSLFVGEPRGVTAAYTVVVAASPTLPIVNIESKPAATTTGRLARFTFRATAATGFECALDGSGFTTCSSPFLRRHLADGPHTFAVRALRAVAAGPAATWHWTILAVALSRGFPTWLLWTLLVLAALGAAAALAFWKARLLARTRRRAGWQPKAGSEPPDRGCRDATMYCQKTEMKIKPGHREVAYLELHARGGPQGEVSRTVGDRVLDALIRALRAYRRRRPEDDVRGATMAAAALLVAEMESFLYDDADYHEVVAQAHLTAAEIEFEFTLYDCAKPRRRGEWTHEDKWKASLQDERDENVAHVGRRSARAAALEDVAAQLAEFLARVDAPASLELTAEASVRRTSGQPPW
jgi:hypothetical protein